MIFVAAWACIALALVLGLLPRDRALPRGTTMPIPIPLSVPVVDIGGMRYLDLRRFPREVLLGYLHVDAAKRSIARSALAASAYVWVMPPAFATMLLEVEGFAKHLLLTRLRDPVPQPTPVFVYVDGWRPDTSHDAIAREAGVQLLLELPRLIGPDEDRDVREMLDEASR